MTRSQHIEDALRNLLAQIELHTDCMTGDVNGDYLVDWMDEAEQALNRPNDRLPEMKKMLGERAVCAELMQRAVAVLHTLDGADLDDEQDLRDLQEKLERMALHLRGVDQAINVYGGVWIDASKDLPDADTTVLVTTLGCTDPVWLGFYNGEMWMSVESIVIEVTHWAELPLAPGGVMERA